MPLIHVVETFHESVFSEVGGTRCSVACREHQPLTEAFLERGQLSRPRAQLRVGQLHQGTL
jgi:hypothetical protein